MKYIWLEGMDGGGKSTTAEILETSLRMRGFTVEHVREPGSTPIAEKIRELVLQRGPTEKRSPATELLLFLAARSSLMDHIKESKADFIISERAWPSSWVYQVKDEQTEVLYERTVNVLRPDIPTVSVLLGCTYETYFKRRGDRREGGDAIDSRLTEETFKQYAERYHNIAGGYDLEFATDDMTATEIVGAIIEHVTS